MNRKKTMLSILILFVVSNILTTVWYMLSDEANMVSFRREEPIFAGLALNHLIFVSGLVYLFPHFIKEQNTKIKSFTYGVVLALIMFLPTGIVVRSIWQVEFNTIFAINTMVHSLIGGVLGLILSVIYNYKK